MTEAILEPDLPIIDPHHHLWDLRALIPAFPEPRHRFLETLVPTAHYTFDQFLADTQTGHNIIGTVFMECGAFYDAARPDEMKPVGEVEFANGVAAQSASGLYGDIRMCAGIVGHANLLLGDGLTLLIWRALFPTSQSASIIAAPHWAMRAIRAGSRSALMFGVPIFLSLANATMSS